MSAAAGPNPMETLFWNTMRRVAEANNDTDHDGDDAHGGGDNIQGDDGHRDDGHGDDGHGDGHSEFGTDDLLQYSE